MPTWSPERQPCRGEPLDPGRIVGREEHGPLATKLPELAVEQAGSASSTGLSLSYALQITQLTNMTVRLASLAENAFNAVGEQAHCPIIGLLHLAEQSL